MTTRNSHHRCPVSQPADLLMTSTTRTRRIVARRSPIHGNGVFAASAILKGDEIIEYKGTLMTHAEADDMYGDGGETGHTFLFTLIAKATPPAGSTTVAARTAARWSRKAAVATHARTR
jgi:SET domain-containing protein